MVLEFGDGTGKGLLDSGSEVVWLLKSGGLGVIGIVIMQLNFRLSLLHFLFRRNFLHSLLFLYN